MIDLYPRLPGIRSILVLRPNAVGDFMFALPALHALRHTYPQARIVLLGKAWHADFLRHRRGPIDEVLVMPPVPGVGAPADAEVDIAAVEGFIDDIREAHFDLALQMYGGGRYSNPFIRSLGARTTVGLKTPDAEPLDRWLPYGELANRRLELLQVAALAGAEPRLAGTELAVTEYDRSEAAECVPLGLSRLVVVHPGASDVRRQWPPERFAAVADRLIGQGARIVISATDAEREISEKLVSHMHHPALDLTGKLSLTALCGLLERSEMMLANDTGPLHLALAVGTPAVGVFWLTNLLESGPLKQHLLRPALSVRTTCPVCGTANGKHLRCAHDVSFVDDVSEDQVSALTMQLFAEKTVSEAAAPPPVLHPTGSHPDPRYNGGAGDRAAPNARVPLC